eukprot:6208154-Pleurochrysis_carterae.AAC.4
MRASAYVRANTAPHRRHRHILSCRRVGCASAVREAAAGYTHRLIFPPLPHIPVVFLAMGSTKIIFMVFLSACSAY